jgi:hypothetical protein
LLKSGWWPYFFGHYCIKNIFENDTSSALNCFSLIEPATTLSDECSANCLQLITDKFGFVVNIASLQSELIAVNSLKNGCHKGYSMRNFAEVMISRHIDQMPETSKLCEIALCILVSTAVCERGFSRQNFKKNKFRNCLGELSLDNLMKICDGPADFENFNFNAAVRHSYAEKKGAKLGYLPNLKQNSRKSTLPNSRHLRGLYSQYAVLLQ